MERKRKLSYRWPLWALAACACLPLVGVFFPLPLLLILWLGIRAFDTFDAEVLETRRTGRIPGWQTALDRGGTVSLQAGRAGNVTRLACVAALAVMMLHDETGRRLLFGGIVFTVILLGLALASLSPAEVTITATAVRWRFGHQVALQDVEAATDLGRSVTLWLTEDGKRRLKRSMRRGLPVLDWTGSRTGRVHLPRLSCSSKELAFWIRELAAGQKAAVDAT